MKGMHRVYFQSARRSGRTTMMLDSLKDGDRVIFNDPRERDRVKRMCRDRKLNVECLVITHNDPSMVFKRPTPVGRVMFDHQWVEDFYMKAIERAEKDIDFFQRESSGFSEAHRETRRAAEEICKWQT